MATWTELELGVPALAATGRRLLFRGGDGQALLATVSGDHPPRIHPVNVGIVDGRLHAFILPSAKLTDLERDGRYALHAYVDAAAPSEFVVRGRAHHVAGADLLATAAAVWSFTVDDSYRLFAFDIESALLGERSDPDEWPPRYTRWPATAMPHQFRQCNGE